MQPSANLALITACIAAFISHVYPRPTPADHVLSPRDGGPGGIDCNGYDSGAVQPKAPTGSSLTWYVTISKGTLPANGLPLAKNNQGTGSALHEALRHKCGDGITFEKYVDDGAPNPDAFCTVVNRGDTSGAEKAVAGFAGVVEGIAHIIPPTKE